MNIPRSFQFACPTRILFGAGALNQLPSELTWLDSQRPMVICQPASVSNGALRGLMAGFEDSGMGVQVCDRLPSTVSRRDASALVDLVHRSGGDAIIALGSGVPAQLGARIIREAITGENSGDTGHTERPLILVPGVVHNRARDFPIDDTADSELSAVRAIAPALAVVDIRTTPEAGTRETACVALAAMTRAVSALASGIRNPMSDVYARAAVQCLSGDISTAVAHPENRDARLALVAASVMAGCGGGIPDDFRSMDRLAAAMAEEAELDIGIAEAALLMAWITRNAAAPAIHNADFMMALSGADAYAACPAAHRSKQTVDTLYEILRPAMAAAVTGCRQRFLEALRPEGRIRISRQAASAGKGRLPAEAEAALLEDVARVWERGIG